MRQFDTVLQERLRKIQETLIEKAKQYQRNDDRYHNFRKAAALTGKTPEQCLWGFALKHIVALDDYINDLPDKRMPQEQWDEKNRGYNKLLILLEGLVEPWIKATAKYISNKTLFEEK